MAVDSEAQLLYVEVYVFGAAFYLGEDVEDQDADALEETAIFGSEDIEEELVHLLEFVYFVLVVLIGLFDLWLGDYLVQIEGLERCCGQLAVFV